MVLEVSQCNLLLLSVKAERCSKPVVLNSTSAGEVHDLSLNNLLIIRYFHTAVFQFSKYIEISLKKRLAA